MYQGLSRLQQTQREITASVVDPTPHIATEENRNGKIGISRAYTKQWAGNARKLLTKTKENKVE
jgi:hypothetical protein